ncbi:MAG: hypothetical protein IPP48_16480 [Chitinophagaceae bacterium]|nr:hypothetical protein [Chitinophagaceae bacterium]
MLPALLTLFIFCCVTHLYTTFSIQQLKQALHKSTIKITFLLVFINVNILYAQIKPTSAAERLAGLQKRKALEENLY